MPSTPKTPAWKILQSLWLIFVFIPFLNWIAFLYIGIRARHKPWLAWAASYFAPVLFVFIVSSLNPEETTTLNLIAIILFIGGQIGSIAHAFAVFREYLNKLAERQEQLQYHGREPIKRGLAWKLSQSLWILFAFIPFLNWIAFLYIGIRGRHKPWLIWGTVYLVPVLIAFFVISSDPQGTTTLSSFAIPLFIGGQIGSIAHALAVCRKYLLMLAARQEAYEQWLKEIKLY
ncbi:MAG TPA: hypothetical protein PKV91_05765 [Bacillota bacterium]|nr:hypothetical protein [Bacillota bacterium]HOA35199.1 hypothetical protein [Bacillota bacterium]HOJ84436.1 hypothetical protein [Bacillota bacterium]HOL16741.1 hypothetical protein [Bacillota bacterium]HPZ11845.1 hypothetical protein [Bacillota bacterium]